VLGVQPPRVAMLNMFCEYISGGNNKDLRTMMGVMVFYCCWI